MRTAALLAAGIARHVEGAVPLTSHDWLRAATLGGARTLGMNDCIGSIEIGKWADLCCVDLARAHTQPVYDPADHLVYAVSRDQVSDVWVAGRQLLSAGTLLHLEIADILERARHWQQRIASTRTNQELK
jgi:5-methylthioadenosine/S-adenosylhomocysteine deaminase